MNWQNKLFSLSMVSCLGFMVLTVAAMVEYSGGTPQNHTQPHYQFFHQPFSDLGRTRGLDGQSNSISMGLFISAMLGGGVGLAAFFIGFSGKMRATKTTRLLSRTGASFGLVAAICFIGVACTPCNLYLQAHTNFVLGAFRSLLIATVLDFSAVVISGNMRHPLFYPFAIFICILVGYIVLLTAGLSGGPIGDPVLQSTGQKIIVYSAIFMVMIQSATMRCASKQIAF